MPALSGCGDSGSVVSGTVTYEGTPLASGSISFAPVDGKGPTSGGPIKDGQYRVEGLLPGQKRVEITGALATGGGANGQANPAPFSKESVERAKGVEEELRKGTRSIIDPIRDAAGNKQVVNVT